MLEKIVIVGAGQAAVAGHRHLAAEGILGRSSPWSAPNRTFPTSARRSPRNILSGALEQERLLLRPADFYADHRVEIHSGGGRAIDRPPRQVRLDNGHALGYDALLLATGSTPRRFRCPERIFPASTTSETSQTWSTSGAI